MDPQLLKAIEQDHTKSFTEVWNITGHDHEFFFLTRTESKNSNILHILCHKSDPDFMTSVITTLPIRKLQTLICQRDSEGNTPLHYATATYKIAKLLGDGYCRARAYGCTVAIPPWRVENNRGELPIHVAKRNLHEKVRSYLELLDPDAGRSLPVRGDEDSMKNFMKNSMKNFDLLVEEYSMPRLINSILIETEESDALQFLKRHQELFNCLERYGKIDILCRAIKRNFVSIVEFILDNNSESISLNGYIPFVVATQSSYLEIAQLLVGHFNKSFKGMVQRMVQSGREYLEIAHRPPWMLPTDMQSAKISPMHYVASMYINEGKLWETPLHYAIYNNQSEFAKSILLWDLSFLAYLAQDEHQRPTPIVVYVEQKGFDLPPKRVDVEGGGYTIHGSDRQSSSDLRDSHIALHLQTFLKFLRENLDINLATKLIERHPQLIKLEDNSGRAILQYALDENDINTMIFILEIHLATDFRHKEQQEEHILTRACRNRNLAAIRAICTRCPDSPEAARCNGDLTTVLDGLRSSNPEEYRSLLRIPAIARIMKETEVLGRSPLDKARQDGNEHLKKALPEMGGIDDGMNINSEGGETSVSWTSKVKEGKHL